MEGISLNYEIGVGHFIGEYLIDGVNFNREYQIGGWKFNGENQTG